MKHIYTFILVLGCCMLSSLTIQAQSSKKSAKQQQAPVVYAFGYATHFSDTTFTMTAVQVLPGAELETKYKYLKHRSYYAEQLQAHLDSETETPTCCIFFDTNKSKLEKMYVKLRHKAQARGSKHFKELSKEEFQFTSVTPVEVVE